MLRAPCGVWPWRGVHSGRHPCRGRAKDSTVRDSLAPRWRPCPGRVLCQRVQRGWGCRPGCVAGRGSEAGEWPWAHALAVPLMGRSASCGAGEDHARPQTRSLRPGARKGRTHRAQLARDSVSELCLWSEKRPGKARSPRGPDKTEVPLARSRLAQTPPGVPEAALLPCGSDTPSWRMDAGVPPRRHRRGSICKAREVAWALERETGEMPEGGAAAGSARLPSASSHVSLSEGRGFPAAPRWPL